MDKKTVVLQHIRLPFLLTDQLEEDCEVVDWLATPREQILARAEDFTVILSSGEDKLDAETIRLFPRAELIAVYGAGYDGVDVQAATECGVRVSNTPDVVTDDVADLAIGFLIMLSRRLKGAERFAAEGK